MLSSKPFPALKSLLLMATCTPWIMAGAAFGSELHVEVSGFKNQNGQLCYSLFNRNKGFPDSEKDALQSGCVKITSTPIQLTFENLQRGSYAVAVFHDENGDGVLNRGVLGIPTEAFGFSNNPVVKTEAPKFGQTFVIVAGSRTNIQIDLRSFSENFR